MCIHDMDLVITVPADVLTPNSAGPAADAIINQGYPAKRVLSAMRKHGG